MSFKSVCGEVICAFIYGGTMFTTYFVIDKLTKTILRLEENDESSELKK